MGSQRNCTWILGLAGFRVVTTESDGGAVDSRVTIRIERRGSRGYGCSGCGRRTRRVRAARDRTWDDLPWASHPVTLIDAQRRVRCRQCGIRTAATYTAFMAKNPHAVALGRKGGKIGGRRRAAGRAIRECPQGCPGAVETRQGSFAG